MEHIVPGSKKDEIIMTQEPDRVDVALRIFTAAKKAGWKPGIARMTRDDHMKLLTYTRLNSGD